jgi:hypothetical protein
MIRMFKITNVSSNYNKETATVTVTLKISKRNADGTLTPRGEVSDWAEWNTKFDCDSFAKSFKMAYERALTRIPDENIIEQCGGLKDGDWVCIKSKNSDYITWGIVFNGNILYMMGSGNYDRVSDFSEGETEFGRITTIVRPVSPHNPLTYDNIRFKLYLKNESYKVYTAD